MARIENVMKISMFFSSTPIKPPLFIAANTSSEVKWSEALFFQLSLLVYNSPGIFEVNILPQNNFKVNSYCKISVASEIFKNSW